jgi:hypothetical protein
MNLSLLEMAVRVYCALVESESMVFPSTIFAPDKVLVALKMSPRAAYAKLLADLSEADRLKVLGYVSAFPPNVPTGRVYVFEKAENAPKFIEQIRRIDNLAEMELVSERAVNLATHANDIQARIKKALDELGGREWEPPSDADFDKLDTELPQTMLQAGYPVELVEKLLVRAVQKADGKLNESIVTGAGPEDAYRLRLDEFVMLASERLVLGVRESLVRAMRKAGVLPEAVVAVVNKALGEDEQGAGFAATAAADQQTAGAPPDKGGVAKDQPDVSKGSPAKSQDGEKGEPKAPTEHVPSVEQGSPTGEVTLPDGTIVPQDVLRQAFAKMLQVLATQVQNNTTDGQPKGPAQEPEEMPAGEKPPGEPAPPAAQDGPPKEEKPAEEEKDEVPPPNGEKKPEDEEDPEKKKPPFAKESADDEAPISPDFLKKLEEYDEARELRELSQAVMEGRATLSEVAPPGAGWEKLVRGLKRHRDRIDNPFALAWWMKKKGYSPETSRASESAAPKPAAPAPAAAAVPAPTPSSRVRTRSEAAVIALRNGKTPAEVAAATLDGSIIEMTATMPDIHDPKDLLSGKASCAYTGTPATIPDGAAPGGKATTGQQLNTTAARQESPSRGTDQPANQKPDAPKAAKSQGADVNPPVAAPAAAKGTTESRGYGRTCPTCKGRVVESCRCARADSVCENGHRWHICTQHRVPVVGESDHAKAGCSCAGSQVIREQDEKDEKKMGLIAWEQAKSQVLAFKAASFNLVTRDLVQASHVAEALGAKKAARAIGKLIVVMKDALDNSAMILKDFDQAHAYFQSEVGGGDAGVPPAAEPAAVADEDTPTEEPAAAEKPPAAEPKAEPKADEKPKDEKPAPPPAAKKDEKPAPPKKEESAQTPATTEASFSEPKDRAVFRLTREGKIPARIRAGDPYAEIAESVRIRCQDLELNAYDVAEVIERISYTERAASEKAIGVSLDEADRKLLAMVVTPRDAATRSIIARTSGGKEAVVTESDLEEAIGLLRRFGDARHKLLADDLTAKLRAEVVASAR